MGVLRHRRSAVLLAAITAFVATPSPAQWRLWPSFYDDVEALDQQQPVEGGGSHVGPVDGHGAGQTFVPRKTPLVRMDFKLRNQEDTRPGLVKLWKWAGSYDETSSLGSGERPRRDVSRKHSTPPSPHPAIWGGAPLARQSSVSAC